MNEEPKIETTYRLLLRSDGATLADIHDCARRATAAGVPGRATVWYSRETDSEDNHYETTEFVWKDES